MLMLSKQMRTALSVLLLLALLGACGCKSTAGNIGLGAAGGAAVGVGGYEYHAKREMAKIEKDLKEGKIDQREYDIRKDQIKRDSLFQK